MKTILDFSVISRFCGATGEPYSSAPSPAGLLFALPQTPLYQARVSLEHRLDSAATLDQCWDAIRDACFTLDFAEARLSAAGTIYFERWKTLPPESCWILRLPLSTIDYISISGPCGAPTTRAMNPFIDVLNATLPTGIARLKRSSAGLLVVAAGAR
jgi:hypothetical protein